MTEPDKKDVGRPQEPLQLPEGWSNEILSLYTDGASDVEVKAKIIEWRGSISNDLWKRWLKDEPEFSETIKKGRQLAAAWWERNGRTNLQNREFNYTGWYIQMKNRFGWKDKSEVDHRTKGKSINTLPAPSFFITPGQVLDENPVATNGNGKAH